MRHAAAMHGVAEGAYEAILAGDWAGLRLLLHPYLHWTGPNGEAVRGRTRVLAMLQEQLHPPEPPAAVELRDGQIYRWRS